MIRILAGSFLLVFALLVSSSLPAQEARPLADNPALETQVHRLSTELRCLVCQNQTLADSSAPLAEDLRKEIRELAASGKSDRQIIDYLVTRYGDFVLYRPPLKSTTFLLWLGPFALLLLGIAGLILLIRSSQKQEAPLNLEQEIKVSELLNRKS
jgi:cytochrome c-type biogenesis protein CcmH